MDIQQASQRKHDLAMKIRDEIAAFECDTGCKVAAVELTHIPCLDGPGGVTASVHLEVRLS